MAALPYMQLYVADYLADTAHLTTEEHGAYLLLLFSYWQTGKSLREDRLASVARLSNERWTDVERTLKEFFHVSKGTWTHFRVEADLEKVGTKSKKNSDAGKASAKARALAKQALAEHESTNVETTVATNVEANAEQTYQRNVNHPRSGDTDTETNTEAKQDQDQKTTSASRRNWLSELVAMGVDPLHARDWLEVRKAKRAKMTDTALKGMEREAKKANITFAYAVQVCAERSWQGLRAEWLANKSGGYGGGTGYSKADDVHAHNQAVVEEITRRQEQRTGQYGSGELLVDDDGCLTIEGDFFHAP